MTEPTRLESRLRAELSQAPLPDLTPDPDLADAVLAGLQRRGRRNGMLLGALAAAVALLLPVGIKATQAAAPKLVPGPRTGMERVGGPPIPAPLPPGANPVTVWAWDFLDTDGTRRSLLLDPDSGTYRQMPYLVVLSPDTRTAAVYDGRRVGVASRERLLAAGADAVRWLPPDGMRPVWSPDGHALLWASRVTLGGRPGFQAHQYDLGTDRTHDISFIAGDLAAGGLGWQPDSRGYRAVTADGVWSIRPRGDTAALTRVPASTAAIGGAEVYSPSRRHAYADGTLTHRPPAVIDLSTGTTTPFPPGTPATRWYDDHTLVQINRDQAALTDITTGGVTLVSLRGVPAVLAHAPDVTVQLGPSAGLTGPAGDLGF
jgi:hypothetical protein